MCAQTLYLRLGYVTAGVSVGSGLKRIKGVFYRCPLLLVVNLLTMAPRRRPVLAPDEQERENIDITVTGTDSEPGLTDPSIRAEPPRSLLQSPPTTIDFFTNYISKLRNSSNPGSTGRTARIRSLS